MIIKEGSQWQGSDFRKIFTVIHLVEIEGKTWVHYRDDEREYSCYQESFEDRFKPILN